MRHDFPGLAILRVLVLNLFVLLGFVTAAGAAVISGTPTLPLLGVPYSASVGVGCFAAAGICIEGGTLVRSGPATSVFTVAGQDITTNATYSGIVTDLSHTPIMPIMLTGSAHELVAGRTTSTETGSWTTTLVDLSLSGTVLGYAFTLELNPSVPSTGITSITPIVGGPNEEQFLIDSFFDVFLELTLDTPVPLTATRGPIRVTAGDIPEPATIALLGGAILGLVGVGRRRFSRR